MPRLLGSTSKNNGMPAISLRLVESGHSFIAPQSDPPHNIEAEQALLGAIMINNRALGGVSSFLEPDHFYDPIHQQIYTLARELIRSGRRADPITLRPYFETTELINDDLTVPQYLGRLVGGAITIMNAAAYGRTIHDLASRRKLLEMGDDIAVAAQDLRPDISPQELAGQFEARLRTIRESAPSAGIDELQFSNEMEADVGGADLVECVLPAGAIACLYGPSTVGKTFVALDLAHSIALGIDFAGRQVQQGAVLYVALEGQSSIARRFVAARKLHGDPGRMLARLTVSGPLGTTPESNTFANKIIGAARTQFREARAPVRLIVVDTLAQSLAGENENEASVMTAAAGHAKWIAEVTGATVLFVHHPGKDRGRGLRGSSALFAAMDAVIAIERNEGSATRTVRLEKVKDGTTGELGKFRLNVVQVGADDRGNPFTSCIVDWNDGALFKGPQRPSSDTTAAKALAALEDLITGGNGRLLDHEQIPYGAAVVDMDEWRLACRQKRLSGGGVDAERKAFQRARQLLIRDGLIGEHHSVVWLIEGPPEYRTGLDPAQRRNQRDVAGTHGTLPGHRWDMDRTFSGTSGAPP